MMDSAFGRQSSPNIASRIRPGKTAKATLCGHSRTPARLPALSDFGLYLEPKFGPWVPPIVNNGYTDRDFSIANPEYHFH